MKSNALAAHLSMQIEQVRVVDRSSLYRSITIVFNSRGIMCVYKKSGSLPYANKKEKRGKGEKPLS
jgi:hypothetical protein